MCVCGWVGVGGAGIGLVVGRRERRWHLWRSVEGRRLVPCPRPWIGGPRASWAPAQRLKALTASRIRMAVALSL